MLRRGSSLSRSVLASFLALAATPVAGCGTPTPIPPVRDTGPRDAAPRDAGTTLDAGDAGIDLDGEVLGDSDVDSGLIDPGSCEFVESEDLFELATDISDRPRTLSIAPSPSGFGVAYAAVSGGLQEIWMATIPSAGSPGGAQQMTRDLSTSLEPAIAWTGSSWLLSWYSNRDGGFEIYARGFGLDGRPTGSLQRLTNDPIREDNPAMAALADGSRIAWIAQAMGGARTALTAQLDAVGAIVGAPMTVTAPGLMPTTPTLVERVGGYALLWGDPSSDAVLVPLSPAGAASTPIILSTAHTADGSVDVTLGESGGLAVFGTLEGGIRSEVHAQLLDETATPTGSERTLTIATDSGRDASVTSLLGGYAVSYRALDTNMLRVAFYSLALVEVARLDLTDIAPDGGRTTIRASGDGALLVAWADRVGMTEVHVRAARIRCN